MFCGKTRLRRTRIFLALTLVLLVKTPDIFGSAGTYEKQFNAHLFLPTGLRIHSQKKSCIPKKIWYQKDQLLVSCLFPPERIEELVYLPDQLAPEILSDNFSVSLTSDAMVTFRTEQDAIDFTESLTLLVCKSQERKYRKKKKSKVAVLKSTLFSGLGIQGEKSPVALENSSEAEMETGRLLFDFNRNFNVYFDSRMFPSYLKDTGADVGDFLDQFLFLSQKSLYHMNQFSLRNIADILKIIAVNCLSDPEGLKKISGFFSPENHFLNVWLTRQHILLSERLQKLAEEGLSKDLLTSHLRDENDFLFICIMRENLRSASGRPSAEVRKTFTQSELQQSRLRIFLILQLFRARFPDYEQFFEEITKEDNGPFLQETELDFDNYGRFSQAGTAVKEFLKMETKARTSQSLTFRESYNAFVGELLSQWLLCPDFFSFIEQLSSGDKTSRFVESLLNLEPEL